MRKGGLGRAAVEQLIQLEEDAPWLALDVQTHGCETTRQLETTSRSLSRAQVVVLQACGRAHEHRGDNSHAFCHLTPQTIARTFFAFLAALTLARAQLMPH